MSRKRFKVLFIGFIAVITFCFSKYTPIYRHSFSFLNCAISMHCITTISLIMSNSWN